MNRNERNCRRLRNLIDIQWGETVDGRYIILFENWKDHDRFEKYFSGVDIELSEGYISCDDCNRYINLNNYYDTEGEILDGYALCKDCLRKDFDAVEAKWLNQPEPVSIRFTDDEMLDQGYQIISHELIYFSTNPEGLVTKYIKKGWETLLVPAEKRQFCSSDYNIWGKRKDGEE